MDIDKIQAIHDVLKRRSINIEWSTYSSGFRYRIWEASTTINGVIYKASYSIGNEDSVEMSAKRIFKSVREDLAAQLFIVGYNNGRTN